jgi:hypothetical protein
VESGDLLSGAAFRLPWVAANRLHNKHVSANFVIWLSIYLLFLNPDVSQLCSEKQSRSGKVMQDPWHVSWYQVTGCSVHDRRSCPGRPKESCPSPSRVDRHWGLLGLLQTDNGGGKVPAAWTFSCLGVQAQFIFTHWYSERLLGCEFLHSSRCIGYLKKVKNLIILFVGKAGMKGRNYVFLGSVTSLSFVFLRTFTHEP